jgi:hypothetical protein
MREMIDGFYSGWITFESGNAAARSPCGGVSAIRAVMDS